MVAITAAARSTSSSYKSFISSVADAGAATGYCSVAPNAHFVEASSDLIVVWSPRMSSSCYLFLASNQPSFFYYASIFLFECNRLRYSNRCVLYRFIGVAGGDLQRFLCKHTWGCLNMFQNNIFDKNYFDFRIFYWHRVICNQQLHLKNI